MQQSSLLGKLPPCFSQVSPHPSQASFESAAFYTEQIGGLSETAHFRAAVAHGDYVEKSNQHQRDGGGGNDPRHCGQPRPRKSCSEKKPSIKGQPDRSEEHTSELQSLMRKPYAVYYWTTKLNN